MGHTGAYCQVAPPTSIMYGKLETVVTCSAVQEKLFYAQRLSLPSVAFITQKYFGREL